MNVSYAYLAIPVFERELYALKTETDVDNTVIMEYLKTRIEELKKLVK